MAGRALRLKRYRSVLPRIRRFPVSPVPGLGEWENATHTRGVCAVSVAATAPVMVAWESPAGDEEVHA